MFSISHIRLKTCTPGTIAAARPQAEAEYHRTEPVVSDRSVYDRANAWRDHGALDIAAAILGTFPTRRSPWCRK